MTREAGVSAASRRRCRFRCSGFAVGWVEPFKTYGRGVGALDGVFEIALSELEGKRFLSQQRTPADRHSLIAHLQTEDSGMARDVAALIVP